MRLKAVIFDFGGVLCFHPAEEQTAELARLCGLPLDELLRAFWRHRIPYDAGQCDARAFWRAVGHSTGRAFRDDQVRDFIRYDVNFWSRLDERMMGWAGTLRRAGWKTALLSNLPPELGAELRARPGFLDQFDHYTFSYEVKSVKPEAEIYRHALRGLGVGPAEALFLDDRIENVEGAAALGIHAVLFESAEQFAREVPARYGLPPLSPNGKGPLPAPRP